MKHLTTIYLIRHGQAVSNINYDKPPKFHTQWGEKESPLTPLGKEQARKRSAELKNIHFDAVFSSDLVRAFQTAEIIARDRKLVIQTTRLIRESITWAVFNKMINQGRSAQSIRDDMEKELQKLDEKGKMAYKYTQDMESAEEGVGRILPFLRKIAITHKGKTVLVINHGTNIRSLLTHLGYAPFDELPDGSLENTAYVVLESDGIDFFVKKTVGVNKQKDARRTL